ncbi:hypothetical protein [Capnocytophaga gingivalis]|uniref:Uncharacterized protein n=1 Tax=Capnocytophaga gingivalis TaxID=1017 RepID=A0ABU5YG95_9FLAO|nr:hypothetical protein [Capnocytophaga gingivalis]MEB3041984.1 hypothetical protein [Capnocytophaga gingivalis]
MLDIYYFRDGVNFERIGYSLYRIGGGSVMNFGGYVYSVDIQEIGNSLYVSYFAARALVDRGSKGILRIKDDDVFKIEAKGNPERTIRIKEIEENISRDKRERISDYIEQPLLPEYSRWNPKKQ